MKKLSIFILLIMFFGISFGQEEPLVTWDGLIKQKEKSDQEILDNKKNKSYKTWVKRAEIYNNIHMFVTAGLYQGMAADGEGFQTITRIFGKPGKKFNDGKYEVWEYNRMRLFILDGILDKWEQTEFIDDKAADKAAEAYLKAVEVDEKGKFKEKAASKDLLVMIKKNAVNDGITFFQKKQYDKSYNLMAYGYELCKLPHKPDDTLYKKKQVGYFLGVIAYNNKKYDESKLLFEQAIKDEFNAGLAYHYIADSYAAQGDSSTYISKIKEGFEKHPDEEQLIIDLINYYLVRKQTDAAVEYIDVAINKKPDNPSYYSAKATIFDNRTETLLDEYKKYMDEAYELKKLAFQNRNNPKKKAEYQKKRDAELAKALKVVDDIEEYLTKAEELYRKSLELEPKFFNAAYNLGRIYLKRNERNALHADYLLKIFINKDFKKSAELEKLAKEQLKISAENFEESHQIAPKDKDVLLILKRIYFRLRDTEKREIVEAKINELGTDDDEIIIE